MSEGPFQLVQDGVEYWPAPRSGEQPQTAYDAQVLCAPKNLRVRFPDGQTKAACVVSPNATSIPLFTHWVQDMRARSDGRYFTEDIMLWAQILSVDFAFFALIDLRVIEDRSDVRWILRYDLVDGQDFTRDADGSHLGQPSQLIKDAIGAIVDDQRGKHALFCKSDTMRQKLIHLPDDLRHLTFFIAISSVLCNRLLDHIQTFDDTKRTFGDLQRACLCVQAWFEYAIRSTMILWNPDVGRDHYAPVEDRFVGAFTFHAQDVEMYRRMGVKCYWVREWPLPLNTKIGKQVAWTQPINLIEADAQPPYPSCGSGYRCRQMIHCMFACANMPRSLNDQPQERRQLLKENAYKANGSPLELAMWKPPSAWGHTNDHASKDVATAPRNAAATANPLSVTSPSPSPTAALPSASSSPTAPSSTSLAKASTPALISSLPQGRGNKSRFHPCE